MSYTELPTAGKIHAASQLDRKNGSAIIRFSWQVYLRVLMDFISDSVES